MHNDLVRSTRKKCHAYMNVKTHRMDFGYGKIRTNVEDDRLSSLPDELIHNILSFISIQHAIRASVLSHRWRSIWTSMPCLNFSSEDLFCNLVSNVLSRRNNQIQVSSVKIGWVSHTSVKQILDYTFSHNVPQVTWDLESNVEFPSSLFSSQSLKHLVLSAARCVSPPFMEKPTWDLPASTTLHLDHITLSDKCTNVFSKFTNLENLSLSNFKVMGKKLKNVLNICHPRLSNLTLQHTYWWVKDSKVVAPQLKNLTIRNCYGKHLIFAPGLTSLVMKGDHPLQLSTDQGFGSLEKLDLCIFEPLIEDVHKIVCLLRQFHSAKFLTLNVDVDILKLLSSFRGLILSEPFAFANLKILKFSTIHPIKVSLEVEVGAQEKVIGTSTEIIDTSPSTIFTVLSCEEIRILRDIVSAEKLITELRVCLEQCKTLEQSKNERLLMTKLQHIEGLLTQLPVSKREVMLATFSSVCEEVDTVTNNMLDSTKIIRYNKKRKCLNV